MDGVFGGGASVFSSAPTFWGDVSGAIQARDTIIAALGLTSTTMGIYDGFAIPYGGDADTATGISSDTDYFIYVAEDGATLPGTEAPGLNTTGPSYTGVTSELPFASFATSTVVPVPAALWLFGSGLLGLIGISIRKKSAK